MKKFKKLWNAHKTNIIAYTFSILLAIGVFTLSIFITMQIANSNMPLWFKLFLTR